MMNRRYGRGMVLAAAVLAAGLSASLALAEGGGPTTAPSPDAGNQMLGGPDTSEMPATSKSFAGDRGKGGPLQLLHRALDLLNLTDDQKTQVKNAIADYRLAHQTWEKTNAAKLKTLQDQAKTARDAKDYEQVKLIGPQIKAINDLMPKPKELLDKIRTLLTPDQLTTFNEKIKELMEERRQMQMGMGGKAKPAPGSTKSGGPTTQPSATNGGTQLNL